MIALKEDRKKQKLHFAAIAMIIMACSLVFVASSHSDEEMVVTYNGKPLRMMISCSTSSGGYKTLDDWPACQGFPRSPKYILCSDNHILFSVRFTGKTNGNSFRVIVTSESSGNSSVEIPLTLNEGLNGIYDNRSRKLYVSRETGASKIAVLDEEVLTCKLELGGKELMTGTVMIDRAEVGGAWMCQYQTYDPLGYPTLSFADDFIKGFYYKLGDTAFIWDKVFCMGDIVCSKAQFAASGDSEGADKVDFALWCGHGPVDVHGSYMRFFKGLINGQMQEGDNLYWSEVSWGDKDMEWMIANTCRYLNGTDAELKQLANGAHLILGYATKMNVCRDAGEYFALRLREMSIKEAWFKQCYKLQPVGKTARVFGAAYCANETLQNGWPVYVKRDPRPQSVYTHWDYTKGN